MIRKTEGRKKKKKKRYSQTTFHITTPFHLEGWVSFPTKGCLQYHSFRLASDRKQKGRGVDSYSRSGSVHKGEGEKKLFCFFGVKFLYFFFLKKNIKICTYWFASVSLLLQNSTFSPSIE